MGRLQSQRWFRRQIAALTDQDCHGIDALKTGSATTARHSDTGHKPEGVAQTGSVTGQCRP
jgi:hypothetical protein